jgi:hypothetical protein
MVDRVELIRATAPYAAFSAATGKKFNDQLTKALALALADLPLESARRLPSSVRADLSAAMDSILGSAELKGIAKKWEPQRKPDSGETQTESSIRLSELLNSKRDSYAPITLSLKEASRLDPQARSQLVDTLVRIAPVADLKRIAKKWDGHNTDLQGAPRAAMLQSLLALLGGSREPTPKPTKREAKRK